MIQTAFADEEFHVRGGLFVFIFSEHNSVSHVHQVVIEVGDKFVYNNVVDLHAREVQVLLGVAWQTQFEEQYQVNETFLELVEDRVPESGLVVVQDGRNDEVSARKQTSVQFLV